MSKFKPGDSVRHIYSGNYYVVDGVWGDNIGVIGYGGLFPEFAFEPVDGSNVGGSAALTEIRERLEKIEAAIGLGS